MASSQQEQLAVLEDFFLETGLAITDVDRMSGRGRVYFLLRDEKTRKEVAELMIDQEGHIIIEHEYVPGIRKVLLRSGLGDYVQEKSDHVRYHTRYVHKISPSERDVGPDVHLSHAHLKNETSLGAALRSSKILGKGERIHDYRLEVGGRIIMFPTRDSGWHSIILTPA